MILKSRTRICKYCGDLHDVRAVPDNCREEPWPRSDLPSPYIISDNLPGGVNGLYHHAAQRKIDSKSRFRDATRAFGCIEMGNELEAATKPRAFVEPTQHELESAINDAMHEVQRDDGKGDDSITVSAEQTIGRGVWSNDGR